MLAKDIIEYLPFVLGPGAAQHRLEIDRGSHTNAQTSHID
jgi:hypothetical protein